jgi:hypothetical protein
MNEIEAKPDERSRWADLRGARSEARRASGGYFATRYLPTTDLM